MVGRLATCTLFQFGWVRAKSAAMTSSKKRFLLKFLLTFTLIAGGVNCAFADVTWDLTNIRFKDGATLTGYFTTLGNTVTSFDVFLNLPGSKPIQALQVASSYLPSSIGFSFNLAYTEFVNLVFTSPIQPGSTSVNIKPGSDRTVLCPTPGGTCYAAYGDGKLIDAPVPEPAAIMLLGTASLVLVRMFRRKFSKPALSLARRGDLD